MKLVVGLSRIQPRKGEQLEFDLAGPGRAWREPWSGLAPRVLTGGVEIRSLRATPARGLRADEMFACKDEQQEQLGQLLLPLFGKDGFGYA